MLGVPTNKEMCMCYRFSQPQIWGFIESSVVMEYTFTVLTTIETNAFTGCPFLFVLSVLVGVTTEYFLFVLWDV